MAERQVSAAVSDVLHRLDQRRMKQEGGDELHDGAKKVSEDAADQPEMPGDDRRDKVNDEGDRQKMRRMRAVHLPRFIEHADRGFMAAIVQSPANRNPANTAISRSTFT